MTWEPWEVDARVKDAAAAERKAIVALLTGMANDAEMAADGDSRLGNEEQAWEEGRAHALRSAVAAVRQRGESPVTNRVAE